MSIATSSTLAATHSNQRTHAQCHPIKWIKWLHSPCKIRAIGIWDNLIDADIAFDNAAHNVQDLTGQAIRSISLTASGDYEYVNYDGRTWQSASNKCMKHGRQLAMPKTVEQLDYMHALAPPSRHMWIGLHRVGSEWLWGDGTIPSRTRWAAGTPDNTAKNERVVETIPNGKWYDLPGTWTAR